MADDTVTFWGDPFRLHWIPIDGAKLNVFLYAWPQGASGECVIDIIGKRRKISTRKAAYIFSHNILPQGVKRITNCHNKAPPGSSITAAHLNNSKWTRILRFCDHDHWKWKKTNLVLIIQFNTNLTVTKFIMLFILIILV